MDMEVFQESSSQAEIIEVLLEQEQLDEEAARVATKYLKSEELTAEEQQIFDSQVADYFDMTCERCSGSVPIEEIPAALIEDDQLCSYCRHMEEKYADE